VDLCFFKVCFSNTIIMSRFLIPYPRGETLSVKFGIYVRQTTIFKRVLDNCATNFLSPYYYLFFNIYVLKPPYINYNPLLHALYYN
jgi:hypothetical protein